MKLSKLNLINFYAKYSPAVVEAGVVAALALSVYIKYRETGEEVRKHFFDVLKHVDGFLFDLNEIRAFDVDKAKLSAYKVFYQRYMATVHPQASVILSDENPLLVYLKSTVSVVPPADLVNVLVNHIQGTLRAMYKEEESA